MGMPQLAQAQIAWLANEVAQYITGQRDRYTPRTRPLTEQQRQRMRDFFTADVLGTATVTLPQGERVQNPEFYPELARWGFHNLPDQSRMDAITFDNIVVSHVPFTNGLLFHELVHIEQYRQLGVQGFSELYVNGFLTGGGYEGIPLEIHAYTLGAQYEANPGQAFAVEEAVRAQIRAGAY